MVVARFFLLAILLFSIEAKAWSNHALGSLLALQIEPDLQRSVTVESLESFLNAQAQPLQNLLDEQERFAREHFDNYPERPDVLRWNASQPSREGFIAALRINPEVKLANFIQQLPGQSSGHRALLKAQNVLVFKRLGPWTQWRYQALNTGEQVSALQVLASAADEPDYGHDINLFSDNPGDAGARYNFGPQPFGDARFEYASQAPFHIGYYHESDLIFTVANYLSQTLPHWRIYQYSGLAKLAFAGGHDYWGYRFLGWALHYLQDLTQPYHARVLPGVSDSGMILIAAKDMLGFSDDREAAIKRIGDRHTAIEDYQFERMQRLLAEGALQAPLLQAYADRTQDHLYPPFDADYAAQVVAAQSHARADEFDQLIGQSLVPVPSLGFSKSNELPKLKPDPALEIVLRELFRNFGAHSRQTVRAISPHAQ